MNKQAIIERIMADARNIKGNAQSMYGSVKDKLALGPQGIYDEFKTKVVQDATNTADALRRRQLAASVGDNMAAIESKDENKMMSIAQLLNMNENVSSKVLGSLGTPGRLDTSVRAAQKSFESGNMDFSPRGVIRRGAEYVAANPDVAIPVGVGAASAGATALLTASGQALEQLTNNMNQALQNEVDRENVLTS